MPYEIREQDDQYCVWKLEPDEVLECYDSMTAAEAYLTALNIALQEEKELKRWKVSAAPNLPIHDRKEWDASLADRKSVV